MEMPGGLAMAERAADRDGLTLDEVTVSLGPVLASWPAGLVVTARLQGGIVTGATVSTLAVPEGVESFWLQPWAGRTGVVDGGRVRRRYAAARRVDSVAMLSAVAGWGDVAWAGWRLRDLLLTDRGMGAARGSEAGVRAACGDFDADEKALGHRWIRRIRRSRTLRWSLRGVGTVADGPGVPPGCAGDTWDRLDARLAEIGCLLSGSGTIASGIDRSDRAPGGRDTMATPRDRGSAGPDEAATWNRQRAGRDREVPRDRLVAEGDREATRDRKLAEPDWDTAEGDTEVAERDRGLAERDRAAGGWAAELPALEVARVEWIVAVLPELLTGVTLAEARLIVAGVDPDLDVLASREVGRG
ncbi:hypothetical protein [Nocardia sp. CC227C]|uniref:hypothetical protein n=1 Tax=Nocardia sp. CC227C TaxID=3044562 RepID=UPI00278BBD40|nr:hypothetical protein [Nocardia sp. CC227C]